MTYQQFITLLIALVLLAGCRQEQEPRKQVSVDLPAAEVRTATVTLQEGHVQPEVVGTVRAVRHAAVAAKITGTIEEMPVVLGSTVKAGDLLVNISAGEISARVVQTQAQLEQARRNLERERKLLLKNAATAENVKSLEDIYKVAEAGHREATTMLGYATLTAPFDGMITSKMASVGDLAAPGVPLLLLEDSSGLQVDAPVPETLIPDIRPGDSLTVHVPVAGLSIQGTVAEIAPAADPLSRTATVRLNIDADSRLRSGQFARVMIPGDRKESLFVPSAAVRDYGQMEQMFVISGNRAYLRLVRTGAVIGDRTEILAGIDSGEVVAVTNVTSLVDGQPVRILE